MKCMDCPYTEIVRDELEELHQICCFSRSENFMTETDPFDSCGCDDAIKKQVYADEDYHGSCIECKHNDSNLCTGCIFGDGDEDLWKWDGEE